MQKTMKKLLSIIIAILMLVTMIPFTPIAFAAVFVESYLAIIWPVIVFT